MMTTRESRVINLLLVAVSVLALGLLGLAFYAYTLADPGLEDLSRDERAALLAEAGRISPDAYQRFPPSGPTLFYHLAPNSDYVAFGTSFTTNDIGFRSLPTSGTGQPDAKRIVLVGDSWTFGPAVTNEETFSQQLQALLNAGGDKWEVHNLSMIGWNTENQVNALRTYLSVLRPDIVVICPTSNDIDDSLVVWRGRLVNDGFESRAIFRYSYEYERRWEGVFRTLDEQVTYLENMGIPTLVYFLAEWRALAPYYARKSGMKANYTVVPTEYIHSRYRLDQSVDYGRHANAEGHRLIGAYLYNALIEADLLDSREPVPLEASVTFPGTEYDDDEIEMEFGFWWPHAQQRDLIPLDNNLVERRGLFSVLADEPVREVVVQLHLLDIAGLYPLDVSVRLVAPDTVAGTTTFREYDPLIQEIRLPGTQALDPYPVVEIELTCSRVAVPPGRLSPVCLRVGDIVAR